METERPPLGTTVEKDRRLNVPRHLNRRLTKADAVTERCAFKKCAIFPLHSFQNMPNERMFRKDMSMMMGGGVLLERENDDAPLWVSIRDS